MNTRTAVEVPKANTLGWIDWAAAVVVGVASLGMLAYTLSSGTLNVSLFDTAQWSWYLVRAAGLTAFLLLTASMLWGVFLSSRIIKDWSPGPVSMLLHATTSWLAIVLSLAHMGLLLFDNYYTYTLADIIIPFSGPYRPLAVGIGIIAFWMIFAVTISFSMRKLIGRKAWLYLHYTSYASFGLIGVHALFAGTDATRPAMLVILGGFSLLVGAMMVMRIRQSRAAKLA